MELGEKWGPPAPRHTCQNVYEPPRGRSGRHVPTMLTHVVSSFNAIYDLPFPFGHGKSIWPQNANKGRGCGVPFIVAGWQISPILLPFPHSGFPPPCRLCGSLGSVVPQTSLAVSSPRADAIPIPKSLTPDCRSRRVGIQWVHHQWKLPTTPQLATFGNCAPQTSRIVAPSTTSAAPITGGQRP